MNTWYSCNFFIPTILSSFLAIHAFSQTSSVDFSGNSRLTFTFNDYSSGGGLLPPLYLTWDGSQKLEYQRLPFELQWNLTTANPYARFVPNAFNIHFASDEFRNRLIQRVKHQSETGAMSEFHKKIQSEQLFKEKQSIDEWYNNSEVKNDFKKMRQYDSLNAILNNTSNAVSASARDSISAAMARVEIPEEKRTAYQKLKERKMELSRLDTAIQHANFQTPDKEIYYELYENPQRLRKELLKSGSISKYEKAGLFIDKFNAGRFSPIGPGNILKGVTVDGAEMAVIPGNIYASALAGRIFPWLSFGFPTDTLPYNRTILAVAAGYGSVNSRHLHLHILQFKDDFSGKTVLYPPSPKANYILAISGGGTFFHGKVILQATYSGSQTTHNISAGNQPLISSGDLALPKPDNPSSWIGNIIYQRKNSLYFSTGRSLQGNIHVRPFKTGTEITGEIKYTGPYYQSFGAPFLPSGYFIVKGGFIQPFAKNKIRWLVNAAGYRNNLLALQYSTSRWFSYISGLQFNFKNLPRIDIIYRPVQQTSPVKRWYHFACIQATKAFMKDFNRSLFTGLYTLQLPAKSFLSHQAMFTYSYFSVMGYRMSVSSSGFFRMKDYPVISLNIKPGYEFFRKWTNYMGFEFYGSKNSSVRQGYSFESSLKISDNISMGLRMGYSWMQFYNASVQNEITPGTKNVFFITSQVLAKW